MSSYRYGVVGVFIDEQQRLLICERQNVPGSWQFPQGGMEEGETPEVAVRREMSEELGTPNFTILQATTQTTSYDFPPTANFPLAKQYTGQKHFWFLLQFLPNAQPSLVESDGEFVDFRWAPIEESLDSVVPWKRDAYREGLELLGLLAQDQRCPA